MAFSSSNSVCRQFRCSGSMGCRLFLTVITAALLLGCVPVRAQPSAVDQGVSLKKLVKDWGSPQFADWGANPDPCLGNWSHVTCDKATKNRVLNLSLASTGLRGPIPASIGELVYLESLNLSTNNVSDPIPPEIGNLGHLQVLVLTANNFTKPPPDDLLRCNNLTRLQMNKNQINGQLPAWIGKMINLKYLDFNSNEMWGGLPPEYGDLVNLTHMQLWENTFSGTLPDSWRNLKSIVNFGMGHLYHTGPIPEWLFEFPNLRVANFMRNQFIGPLPNLTRLMHNGISNFTTWDFSCNYLTGDYPTGYYQVLPIPNTTLRYYSNCYNNETDGSATINSSKNATQNTPMNCSRTFNCDAFFLNFIDGCAPCPPSQSLLNQTNCVCGKTSSSSRYELSPAIIFEFLHTLIF